jgi:hypothetical protein
MNSIALSPESGEGGIANQTDAAMAIHVAARALFLHVVNGKHAGAKIALDIDVPLTIGTAPEADVLLMDASIKPVHARICRTSEQCKWTAQDAGVGAFGCRIPKGRDVLLDAGASMSIGEVQLYLGGAEYSAAQALAASRRFLLRKAPLRLLMAEWGRLHAGSQIAMVASVVFILVAFHYANRDRGSPTFDDVEELSLYVKKTFPDAWVRLDDVNHTVVYGGYVADRRELDRLRLHVWNTGIDVPAMRVYAMDDLLAATRAFLLRFYTDPQLIAQAPGHITVEVQRALPAKSLVAWDFEEVGRQATSSVPGLKKLEIALIHDITAPTIRVPFAQLGLNLVNAPKGRYLSGARGERYFAGAVTKEGTVLEIASCWATFQPAGKTVVYRLVAAGGVHEPCE